MYETKEERRISEDGGIEYLEDQRGIEEVEVEVGLIGRRGSGNAGEDSYADQSLLWIVRLFLIIKFPVGSLIGRQ